MKKKVFNINPIAFYYLIIPAILIILEAIPYSVLVHHSVASSTGDIVLKASYYSYFDLEPFKNMIYSPFIIAISNLVTIALLFSYALFNKKQILYTAVFLIFAMIIMSIMQMIVVFKSFGVMSWFILILNIGQILLIFLSQKRFIA